MMNASTVPSQPLLSPPSWWSLRLRRLVRRVKTAWRPRQVFLRPEASQRNNADLVPGHAAALASWVQWCELNAGSHCELALSSHWLLSSAASPDEATQQWDHYFGLSADKLASDWVLRSVDARASKLVCAVRHDWIDALQATAREHGVGLRWVGPWWARGAQHWLAQAVKAQAVQGQAQDLTAVEPGLLIRFQAHADETTPLRLASIGTEPIAADWVAPVAAAKLGAGPLVIESPEVLDGLLAEWPTPSRRRQSSWADALDFVGPRVRTALWAWALLVLGLAASLGMADQAQQVFIARSDAQDAWRRLERAQHQKALARTVPRVVKEQVQASMPALDDSALHRAVQVVQLLAYPWAAVIDRIEQSAAQEKVVLTGLSLDVASAGSKAGASPDVRLQAAVLDDASALRWLQLHGDEAQLLNRNVLTTPFDTVSGHYALRIEAIWPANLPVTGAQP